MAQYGETPLLLASENGHVAVVSALLKARVDPEVMTEVRSTTRVHGGLTLSANVRGAQGPMVREGVGRNHDGWRQSIVIGSGRDASLVAIVCHVSFLRCGVCHHRLG